MGQILFWVEAAIASVIFVALGQAILARIHRLSLLSAVGTIWGILVLAPWFIAIASFAAVQMWAGGAVAPLASASVAFICFIAIAALVIGRGRKPSAITGERAAASWRLNRLALASIAAILLTCMTFWNLDLAVRQEMATMRVEAGAIALSIAPARVPESQNAAVLYRQAWETLDAQKGPDTGWGNAVAEWVDPNKRQFNPDDEQMLAFLQKQGPVIGLLQKAATLPACNFGTDYSVPSIDLVLPPLGKMRSAGKLLCLSARVAAHQGRMVEAMKDLNTALALADHCTADPALIASLVAIAVEDQAFKTFQYVLDQGALTNESISALQPDTATSFDAAFHRGVRMESAFGMSFFYMPDPFAAISAAGGAGRDEDFIEILRNGTTAYRVFLWEKDVQAYLRWIHRHEQLSSQPYYRNIQEWGTLSQEPGRKKMGGPLTTICAYNISRGAEYTAKADAQHKLIVLAVAMWQYRLAQGAFPSELDQLTPKYMLTVPIDPFTGKGMTLAQADGQLVIYSVGPDLKDDGGKPFDKETKQGDISLSWKTN